MNADEIAVLRQLARARRWQNSADAFAAYEAGQRRPGLSYGRYVRAYDGHIKARRIARRGDGLYEVSPTGHDSLRRLGRHPFAPPLAPVARESQARRDDD